MRATLDGVAAAPGWVIFQRGYGGTSMKSVADGSGDFHVAGWTSGSSGGQVNPGGISAFVRRYEVTGGQ
jgi:hypothetical protein